jgi:hypothetical protein
MTRSIAANITWLRAIALVMATFCILAGSLTMPAESVQAGFTPGPTSPVPTPVPPTAIPPTAIPPTAIPPTVPPGPAPTRRSGSGGGGGGDDPSSVAEAPPAPAPLPETGHANWWPSIALFMWGGSLLLLLPLLGPLHRRWKQHAAARVQRRMQRW